MPLELRIDNLMVCETRDNEIVIAEYDYDGRVVPTDETVRVSNVQILRVHDGEIVRSRDYDDHAAIAAVLDAARQGANANALRTVDPKTSLWRAPHRRAAFAIRARADTRVMARLWRASLAA